MTLPDALPHALSTPLRRNAALLRTGALLRHNTALLLREPGPLLSRIVLPLVFLTLLRPLYTAASGRQAGTLQATTGTLVTFSLLALSIVGGSIMGERFWHTWDRLRASTAHPAELLAGKALPVLAALLLQQAVLLGYAAAVLGLRLPHPLLLAAALLCWSLALLGLGALLGITARSMGALSAAYDIGGMVLSSLGGAMVPLTQLPHWVRHIAPVSPGYWTASALHACTTGDAARTAECCAVLLAIAAATGALAAVRLRRAPARSALL